MQLNDSIVPVRRQIVFPILIATFIVFGESSIGLSQTEKAQNSRLFIDFCNPGSLSNVKCISALGVRKTAEGFVTQSESNPSIIKLNTGLYIPSLTDSNLMRIEWTFVPQKIGGFGQDFRILQGPVVVEIDKGIATLNTKVKSQERILQGRAYTFVCEFDRSAVYSWKINGNEQLSKPISAWKVGAEELIICAVDWKASRSKTLWKSIQISYVSKPAKISLDIWLKHWDEFPIIKRGTRASFLLGYASSMQKVFREAADFKGKYLSIIDVCAAQNERESFQIVVIPLGQIIRKVAFEPTPLMHMDKNTLISASNIRVNPIGYVKTVNCSSAGKRIGWAWPDIILPDNVKVNIKPGYVQPFWCTIKVPKTKAGIYRGFIKVKCNDNETQILRIRLRVFDYMLPKRSYLKTCFGFAPQYWDAWHKPDLCRKLLSLSQVSSIPWGSRKIENVLSFDEKRKLFDFASRYRISLTDIYSSPKRFCDYRTFPATPKEVEYCYRLGMNVMCLGYVDEWGMANNVQRYKRFLRCLEEKLQYWDSFVRRSNWKDFYWILHCFDESASRSREKQKEVEKFMQRILPRIKKRFPWIKIETANPYIKKYAGLFDIWTVTTGCLEDNRRLYKSLIANKKCEIWAYTTNGSVNEANFMLDYPGMYPRIMAWHVFAHKITGILYFETDCFSHQKNAYVEGKKWPNVEWNPEAFHANSDGILFYPWHNCLPLASIRLANFRDGLDDYDALTILVKLADKLEKTKSVEKSSIINLLNKVREHLKAALKMADSFRKFPKNSKQLYDERIAISELIERCQQELNRSCPAF